MLSRIEINLSYENPIITTTSRAMLADIYRLSRRFNSVDIPRPIAVIYTLFGLELPTYINKPLLHALKAWSDIGDISETEGFGESTDSNMVFTDSLIALGLLDGHRKTIVEHTLNVLVLPRWHTDSMRSKYFAQSADSLLSAPSHPTHPALPIPGTSLTVPSPLHFQLHIITRLSFNEQGRITHHRDFWDIKDVMRLIPGVPLAQWIGTRVAALVLTYIARSWITSDGLSSSEPQIARSDDEDIEQGISPTIVTSGIWSATGG
ncbi:hypothetical protein VNI00_005795 [Paramarasmius palmivorus]|uniref:SnoaL-like domain-containing protein n=1 Tax=Paramarasmius palmivorus TaxID=297713 RepID=A0AAW0DGB8_9AGAR